MSDVDLSALRLVVEKSVERFDKGDFGQGLDVYAPEFLALLSRLEQAEQAVARVREALSNHPRTCDRHTEDDPVKCGWKRAVIDVQRALDGEQS